MPPSDGALPSSPPAGGDAVSLPGCASPALFPQPYSAKLSRNTAIRTDERVLTVLFFMVFTPRECFFPIVLDIGKNFNLSVSAVRLRIRLL